MAASGEHHGGILLIDGRQIRSNDFGGLVKAVLRVWDEQGDLDWIDRVEFLQIRRR